MTVHPPNDEIAAKRKMTAPPRHSYSRSNEIISPGAGPMGCLGVHFALTKKEVDALCAIPNEQDRLNHLQEQIEETYFSDYPEHMAQSDKSWDAMHRTLADGELTWDGGEYPLNHVILAGRLLYSESDYIMSLKTPEQVQDIAKALPGVDESQFRSRYFRIDPDVYGCDVSDEDFQYTWDWFQEVRALYLRAADDGRYVLFTASQ
ncbi:MAG: YfbM family protein [Planctomycetia bacterium]|nr:YfbM family protein [Planctomycetia bacterium]